MNKSADDGSAELDAQAVRTISAIRKLSQEIAAFNAHVAYRRGRVTIATSNRDTLREAEDKQALALLNSIEMQLRVLFIVPEPVPPILGGQTPIDPQPPAGSGQGNQPNPQTGLASYNCPICGTEMIVTPKV